MKVCAECGACSEDTYDLCAFDGGVLRSVFPGPRVLEGRYLLEQRVAGGAMGDVFRAMHLQVGSTVAVKVMQPQKGELRVGVQRFHREAQILGQIKHPHAVLVMDFGIDERGDTPVPYLVTEFLRGRSLHELMAEHGAYSVADTLPVVRAICSATDEAHSVGVIHRDIKPSNVFVEQLRDRSQIVKVLDFGIAKFVELAPEVKAKLAAEQGAQHPLLSGADVDLWEEVAAVQTGSTINERVVDKATAERAPAGPRSVDRTITEAGFMIGTIPYMAPEQMTGERVSRATDVFAIATVMFEMLAGQRPFGGSDDEVINAKVSDERPSLLDFGVSVSPAFDAFVQSCFALESDERPGSVLDIAQALEEEARRQAGPSDDDDAPLALSVQLSVVERVLDQLEGAVSSLAGHDEDTYRAVRDRMLALNAPLERADQLIGRVGPGPFGPDHKKAAAGLAGGQKRVAAAIRAIEPQVPAELVEYLTAIWASLQKRLERTLDAIGPDDRTDQAPAAPPVRQNPFADGLDAQDRDVEALAAQLLSKDPLDRIDALDALLTARVDRVLALAAQAVHDPSDTARTLIAGLAAHADAVLLAELYPQGRAVRLLPLLAQLPLPEAAPFAVLARMFQTAPRGEATAQFLVDDALSQVAGADAVQQDVIWRCLLVHPLQVVRIEAAARVPLSSLWTVITYPRTPLSTLRAVFDAVKDRAPAEYLKIFFLCVRGPLTDAQGGGDLEEALLLLERFYREPCFSEDVVFEPLLALDQRLRARARTLGQDHLVRDGYLDNVNAFTARGATPTQELQHMRDVPLAVQRKVAREGHFLSYFVAHNHERVAKETIPHLLRLEDVTPYLRIPTIHRVVLSALAKKRRFFRRDAPRLALLQNPKAPAHVARVYLPLVPVEQIRLLSLNKHVNQDVRSLARAYLERLAAQRQHND